MKKKHQPKNKQKIKSQNKKILQKETAGKKNKIKTKIQIKKWLKKNKNTQPKKRQKTKF